MFRRGSIEVYIKVYQNQVYLLESLLCKFLKNEKLMMDGERRAEKKESKMRQNENNSTLPLED